MRPNETTYEVVVAARPYGPPLTSTEQALRVGLAIAFIGLLAVEAWLLWNAWSLWG
jgi:hypothetical protein